MVWGLDLERARVFFQSLVQSFSFAEVKFLFSAQLYEHSFVLICVSLYLVRITCHTGVSLGTATGRERRVIITGRMGEGAIDERRELSERKRDGG